jgi:hypothetical protein
LPALSPPAVRFENEQTHAADDQIYADGFGNEEANGDQE